MASASCCAQPNIVTLRCMNAANVDSMYVDTSSAVGSTIFLSGHRLDPPSSSTRSSCCGHPNQHCKAPVQFVLYLLTCSLCVLYRNTSGHRLHRGHQLRAQAASHAGWRGPGGAAGGALLYGCGGGQGGRRVHGCVRHDVYGKACTARHAQHRHVQHGMHSTVCMVSGLRTGAQTHSAWQRWSGSGVMGLCVCWLLSRGAGPTLNGNAEWR